MKTWTFRRVPESTNRLLRSHWAKRRREARRWRNLVVAICGRRSPPAAVPVALAITVHRYRTQDPDNAYASVKHLLDALVRAGWLKDDAASWLKLEVREEEAATLEEQRTEVHWVELEPSASPVGGEAREKKRRSRTCGDRGPEGTGHDVRCADSRRSLREAPRERVVRKRRCGGQEGDVRCEIRERPSKDASPR